MDLSRVTQQFTESIIRDMTRVALRHPGSINLAQGFPDFPAPESIKNTAIEAIQRDKNQYAITWGTASLREAIAAKARHYNRIEADPDKNITVTCGATEAMMASLKAVINPGDEIIIFEPFYENYGPDCLLSGATPRYIRLRPPDWSFDFGELENIFNSKTKAVVINTPNNPTGKVFSEEELRFIARFCVKYDVIAITDEIYEHIMYDDHSHLSIASFPEMAERSITINSISKTYSLTGWRVGWAIASDRITREIRKVHDFLTVGAATPLQEGAAFALTLGEGYYRWLAEFYQNARDTLYYALLETDLHPYKPAGAYYIMCECTDFMQRHQLPNSLELAYFLVKNIGVATVPGSSFYSDPGYGQFQIRFCFCKNPETLQKAQSYLSKIPKAARDH
ncbi:MAG: aminotransferase class I/II-fold pyridoxal phosphate-dependent enzyme [Dehalococcoidia bacterium]|nr:MAG: aminotransferase class I/II-fold pyridoxal phosphate-dependent enzyme [Dehalococcoidia bacterium]